MLIIIFKTADHKYNRLIDIIRASGSVLVAYSGGVDSTFLLYAVTQSAVNALAVTSVSPTMPSDDLKSAQQIVQQLGVTHRLIETNELENDSFSANHSDRCFHCKSGLFQALSELSAAEGYDCVAEGSNADDLNDYRPGLKARELYNIRSPLMEADLHKDEIRLLSKKMGLPTWNKPSSPCLSSRFPYGQRITAEGLQMVQKAETLLKEMGFGDLRVRKQADVARIEIAEKEFARFLDEDTRVAITSYLRGLGFLYVTLDLEGFQSGKLNRVLAK